MECFNHVRTEIDESLTKKETKKETFKVNILYLKCIIRFLISHSQPYKLQCKAD